MTNALDKKLKSLEKAIAEKEAAKVYQFPLWGEPQRGVPNDFARSALFSARKGTGGEYLRSTRIFSQGNISITYSGPRLTQDHLDVFEGIMHLARAMPEGNTVRFTERGLLKQIGRTTSGSDYKRLLLILADLTATAIIINRKGSGIYCGSLLPEWGEREHDGMFSFRVNRPLIKLFERGFTIIELEQRKKLARSSLAKAIHVWLCSHEKPYPVTVQYLHDITGSNNKSLKSFRQKLIKALNKLKENGILKDWRIDERDKVHFVMAD